jgi:hypothetical protein
VPPQLDLFRLSEQAQQFLFVGMQQLWALDGDLLCCIRRPHPDNRIVAPHALNEFGEALWLP